MMPRLPKENFTEEEIRAVINATGKGVSGVRNKALLMLLYKGCLRIGEALELKPKDVDFQKMTVRILHGKGDKSRTVAIDAEAVSLIEHWLSVRSSYADNRKRLFCLISKGKEGQEIEASYVRHLVKRLALKAGIGEKRVHPHAFRYTGATHLRDRGASLAVIQQQLGHSRYSTTDIYLRDVSPQRVVEEVQKAWE